MPPPVRLALVLFVLSAVVGGGPLAPAHAQLRASPAAHSAASPADLPPSLSALRSQLFAPTGPPSPPNAERREDRWIARDKARHVVFSGLWTLSTQYVLVSKADWAEADALPVSVASSTTIGLLKELYDASRPTGRASGKDLAANAVGIGLAAGLIAL